MTRTPTYPQGFYPRSQMSFKVTRNRRPTGLDYRHPDTGKYYDISTQWQVGKNPTDGVEGELWFLTKIVANVAYWVQFNAATAVLEVEVDNVTAPGVQPVTPDGSGLMTVQGAIVAAHSIPIETHSRDLYTYNVEIQNAVAVGVSTAADSGVSHFDSAAFTVDANGFVGLVGAGAATTHLVGDDGLSVVPTAGAITLLGAVVAANANANRPVYFKKNATSIEELDVQVTTTATVQSDTTKVGLSSFDSASFAANSSGWVTSKFGNSPGESNLGVSYSGGTFTVTSANGGTLSSTNTAYVTFQDATNIGRLITMPVTNPYTFTDAAGSNEIGANLFGITTGVAWGSDCPFYLYAVVNSAQTDVAFGFGRVPNLSIAPVAGKLAVAGTTAATTQGSLFLLKKNGATPTVADFASQPVVLLGSFRMQATLTPAWTVQALSAQKDGIGNFNETTTFTYPKNQNGAVAANHFLSVGGDTAPVWTNQDANYKITRLGQLNYFILYSVQTGNGSGTAPWKPTIPLQSIQASNQSVGWWASQAVNASSIFAVSLNADTSNCSLPQHGLAGGLTVGQFVSGGATGQFSFNLIYTASVL